MEFLKKENFNIPNILSFIRIIIIIPFVLYFLNDDYLMAALMLIFSGLSDMFDGIIARKRGIVTDFGKLMDPLSDKTLVFAAYIILFDYGWHTDIVIMIMLAREFLVAGIRMAAASNGEVVAANAFGKAKTFLQMSTTGLTFLFLAIGEGPVTIDITTQWLHIYCTVAFWIVGIITLLSGLVYAKDGWHLIKTK